MAEADRRYGDFISSDWVDPKPELHLVDGVWKPVVAGRVPPSSSRNAGTERKPTTLAEKKAREAAEREAEEAATAAAGEAEIPAAEAETPAAEAEAPAAEAADEDPG
ncbi:MAG TPA: hypothetical protein VGC54_04550 [Planctomycetota bacterium]